MRGHQFPQPLATDVFLRTSGTLRPLIPPGQEQLLFAARPELGIPGTAPMVHVSDSGLTTVTCWFDGDEPAPGHYQKGYAPPVLVRDAWGRAPA